MRLSISAVFEAGSIDCFHFGRHEDEFAPEISSARAVFITESSVARAREIEAGFDLHDSEIRRQEFNYGDIVVARIGSDGQTIGSIARGGQDAGICLRVERNGSDAYVPFSGENMFSAKEFLNQSIATGRDLTENETRAMNSIDELFAMAIASPDPERFPESVRGMAARSVLLQEYADVRLGVSNEELLRYFRGTSLRNEIVQMDPTHPDAPQSRTSHADLVAGIAAAPMPGAVFRNIGSLRASELTGRVANANDVLLRNIFGAMTNTPIEELSVSMLDPEQLQVIRGGLTEGRLTGEWIDGVKAHVSAVLRNGPITPQGRGATAYQFEMDIFEREGRDILMVVDGATDRNQGGYIYSWPSTDRHLVTEFNGQNFATISPESVPSDEEITRLSGVVQELRERFTLEVENYDM